MLQSLKNILSIPDLRRKIIFTLMMLLFFRVGAHVPVPFIDALQLEEYFTGQGAGGVFGFVDMFTGGAFKQMTVMALGVMPYISASIIIQLMTVVVPTLEKLNKEGEAGRRKINQLTRYFAVTLTAFQAFGIGIWLLQKNLVVTFMAEYQALFLFTTVIALTAGSTFLLWIGERITERGIGNGISLIIAYGIIAAYPTWISQALTLVKLESLAPIWLLIVAVLFVVATVSIIYIQEGQRKIPIQHAKRVIGKRVQQGQTNFLPLKVNTAGVIPVIFSSAILTLPATVFSWVGADAGFGGGMGEWFSTHSSYNIYNALGMQRESIYLLLKVLNLHTLFFIVLTVFFAFFYTAVVFNPIEVAENLKKVGAFVPGYRPGKQTADYIDHVLSRVTMVGAVFLVMVALLPQVLMIAFNVPFGLADFAGGTGLIIVVGVVLDTMKEVESQLLMRHYEGFKLRRQASGGRRWSSSAEAPQQ